MKILFCHDHRFYQKGEEVFTAGNLYLEKWHEYLAYADEITVMARRDPFPESGGNNLRLSSGEGVRFHFLPDLFNPKYRLLQRRKILIQIREEVTNADFVIVRLPSEIGSFAAKEAIRQNKKWMVEMVGCPWDGFWNFGFKGKALAHYITNRTKRLVKQAPAVMYVTTEFLQGRYPTDGKQIGVSDVELAAVDDSVLQSKLDYLKAAEAFNIGFVGSLDVDYKGLDVLLKAVAAVKDQLPPITVKVLGKGDTSAWQGFLKEHQLTSNVEFLGTLPFGKAVFDFYDSLHLFVLPSKQEGLPRSLVEAMSRANPCLGSDAGGVPELLPAKWIHQKGDIDKLAEHLLKMLGDKDKMKEAATTNFKKGKQFEIDTLERRRTEFLKNIITG